MQRYSLEETHGLSNAADKVSKDVEAETSSKEEEGRRVVPTARRAL